MDLLEVTKKHGVLKIGVFCSLFCLGMLGKSTSYSTETQPLVYFFSDESELRWLDPKLGLKDFWLCLACDFFPSARKLLF
jgi:hypothetical protein